MSFTKNHETIASKITKLENHHHVEILRIIKESDQGHHVNITENSNGCFLNMNDLSELMIMKIEKYIEFHESQEKEHNDHLLLKNDIIDTLNH